MKHIHYYFRIVFVTLFMLLMFQGNMYGQKEVKKFLKNSIADGSLFLDAYFTPWSKSMGAAANSGWFNTAAPHKTGRFDLTFSMPLVFIPKVDQNFDISALDTKVLKLKNTNESTGQTLFGENENGPWIEALLDHPDPTKGDTAIFEFQSPPGVGFHFMPLPVAQAAVGIYKKTEVMIRFLPQMNIGAVDLKIKYWGVGIKHDILQWFGNAAEKAPLALSVMAAYTSFYSSVGLEMTPDYGTVDNTGSAWDDQVLEFGIKAFTINALVSKKLAVITFYGGIGYNSSKTTLDLTGSYPIVGSFDTNPASATFGKALVTAETDPISLESKGANGIRGTLGFRLKFGPVTWHNDYTASKYSTFTTGLGLCIDWGD